MSDKKQNSGGKRARSGRKPKADEIKLIERIDNLIDKDEPINIMLEQIQKGNMQALKLYMEYRYGKPKESLDVTSNKKSIDFNELLKFGTRNNSTS